MANWPSLIKATGVQPVVIGSVNSFWTTPTAEAQGNIKTNIPGITTLFSFYSSQTVSPLTSLTENNSSVFVGFPADLQLSSEFSIYNNTTLLTQNGRMQQLVGRDPGNPFNASITLYAPHLDFAPLGHIGLIEAFTVNFDNLLPGDPWSADAQTALTELGSRIWDYSPVLGPTWAGNVSNFFLDQVNGWFARGGAMSYADDFTANLPVMVRPQ